MSDEKDNNIPERPEDVEGIRNKRDFSTDGGFSDDRPSIVEQYASSDDDKGESSPVKKTPDEAAAGPVDGLSLDDTGEDVGAVAGSGGRSDDSEQENAFSPSRVPPPVTSGTEEISPVSDVGAAGDDYSFFDDVSDFDEEGYDFSEDSDEFNEDDMSSIENIVAAEKKKTAKLPRGGKRFVAPLVVLLAAGGVGGYIVMNPDVIGGNAPANVAAIGSVPGAVSSTPVQTAGASSVGNTAPVSRQELDRPFEGAKKDDVIASVKDGPEYPVEVSDNGLGMDAVPRPPAMKAEPFSDETEGGSIDIMNDDAEMPDMAAFDAADDDDFISGFDGDLDIEPDAFDEPIPDVAEPDVKADVVEAVTKEVVAEPEAVAEDVAAKVVDATPPEEIKLAQAEVKKAEAPVVPDNKVLETTPVEKPAEKKPSPYGSALVDQASDKTAVGTEALKTAAPPAVPKKYFDAETQIPTGKMATDIGPRKVDPVLEPAQKYVIVTGSKKENDPETMLVSANRALKLKRYDAAVEMFEQLYDRNSRDPRILMGLAVALQHSGRAESALMVYDELLDLAPGNREAVVNMLGLLRQQYPSVAVRRLMDLQNQFPNDPMIAAQLGVTQADMRDYDEAEKYLGIAISLEPHNAQHYMNMAVIADRQGDKPSAVSYYEEALQVDAVYGNSRSINREVVYDRLSVLRR